MEKELNMCRKEILNILKRKYYFDNFKRVWVLKC